MATPAELRAKLLAQRAAQQEESRKKDEIHEQAKVATKSLVMLGYNFDDILEALSSELTAEHLHVLFKSVGIHRKRSYLRSSKPTPFGAARWLDRPDNFIIDIDGDITSGDSEEEVEIASPEDDGRRKRLKGDEVADPLTSATSTSSDLYSSVEATETHPVDLPRIEFESQEYEADAEPNKPQAQLPAHEATIISTDVVGSTEQPQNEDVDMNDAPILSSSTQETTKPDQQEANKIGGKSFGVVRSTSGNNGSSIPSPSPELASPDLSDISMKDETTSSETESKDMTVTPVLGSQLAHDEPMSDASDADKPTNGEIITNEQLVQQEIERVKAKISEMQQRKVERTAKKELEQEMAKRSMELRNIASRRALLIQKKSQLDLNGLILRISHLERKLGKAKKEAEETRQQLKNIDTETAELEQRELKLREELARPRSVVAKPEESQPSTTEPEEQGVEDETVVEFPLLTARDSPLRMFSSFRMCPSMGPAFWFSRSFNGRFIPDLADREMCPNEMRSKRGRCNDVTCEYVHFADFDVPKLKICQYMATRQIDKPNFREELAEAIQTHLSGTEVSPEKLAASIIGFSRKYDCSQILDWQSWGVERPL